MKTIEKNEDKKYPCVFKLTDDCPVKSAFKLKPENLRPWCEICPKLLEENVKTKIELFEKHKKRTE